MSKALKYLVLHCTASPEGREISAAQIRSFHTSPPPAGRGWRQVGYSDIIHLNGEVENLVPYNDDGVVDPWEITNGHAGINAESRHVVYVGGMDKAMKDAKDTRTVMQKLALANYVKQTIAQHPTILVAGHNQFAAKACPSFDVPKFLREIGVRELNIFKKL